MSVHLERVLTLSPSLCFAVDENSKESSLHRILEEGDQRSRLFFL